MVGGQCARFAMALRPGHAVGRAGIRSHEPADADEPCSAVLDRLDGTLARRPRPREAPKAEVITAWGRLGYPRRALRLQECARVVAEDYADKLPRTYDELTALPGIGDYTASAVMSFAFGERIAVIDTNIRRVLSACSWASNRAGERPARPNARWRTACCPKTRFSGAMLTSPIMPVAPNMS